VDNFLSTRCGKNVDNRRILKFGESGEPANLANLLRPRSPSWFSVPGFRPGSWFSVPGLRSWFPSWFLVLRPRSPSPSWFPFPGLRPGSPSPVSVPVLVPRPRPGSPSLSSFIYLANAKKKERKKERNNPLKEERKNNGTWEKWHMKVYMRSIKRPKKKNTRTALSSDEIR